MRQSSVLALAIIFSATSSAAFAETALEFGAPSPSATAIDHPVAPTQPVVPAQPAVSPPPALPAPAASAPDSRADITATAPEGCRFVKITRPDIDPSRPKIYLTFRGPGSGAAAISACNPDSVVKPGGSTVFGVVESSTSGTIVSIRTVDGVGIVGLPTMYVSGYAHQVHCIRPTDGKMPVDEKFAFNFYRFDWKGGLPDSISLLKADMADTEGWAICRKAVTPDMRAQLKK